VAAEDCLFCRLAAGVWEASVVHEDARTVTLLDVQPVNSGTCSSSRARTRDTSPKRQVWTA
jgi:hypothetical protein